MAVEERMQTRDLTAIVKCVLETFQDSLLFLPLMLQLNIYNLYIYVYKCAGSISLPKKAEVQRTSVAFLFRNIFMQLVPLEK